jgi:DNA-binding XRE family transcriptional regulator
MDASKKKRLEKAGWRVGDAQDFLELSTAEAEYVEIRASLARALSARRKKLRVTQVEIARRLESSQSRVAKMESGDSSVSLDLMIKSLLRLGASRKELAKVVGTVSTSHLCS